MAISDLLGSDSSDPSWIKEHKSPAKKAKVETRDEATSKAKKAPAAVLVESSSSDEDDDLPLAAAFKSRGDASDAGTRQKRKKGDDQQPAVAFVDVDGDDEDDDDDDDEECYLCWRLKNQNPPNNNNNNNNNNNRSLFPSLVSSSDAVEACEDTEEMKECAIAWEAVEELRDAADRKRLGDEVTTNNGDGFMVLEGGNGAAEGQKDYPAGLQGRDFLADVAPCEAEECDAPSGSLFAAGGLERSIQRLEMEKGEEAKRKEKEEGEGNL